MAKKNFWNKLKYLFVEEVKQKKYNLKDLDEIDRKKEDKEKNTEEKNKETKIDETIEIINTSQENENIENNIQLNNDENQSIDESNENEDSISKETEGIPQANDEEVNTEFLKEQNLETDTLENNIKKQKVSATNNQKNDEYTTVDYNAMLEKQEERIKKAGNIPEEEKQKLIDELYKNFELFVGETNNSEKTR